MASFEELTGCILSDEQVSQWQEYDLAEYNDYVASSLYDPVTHELYAYPDWMVDNDPSTGPFEINTSGFDFGYNNSHEGQGW